SGPILSRLRQSERQRLPGLLVQFVEVTVRCLNLNSFGLLVVVCDQKRLVCVSAQIPLADQRIADMGHCGVPVTVDNPDLFDRVTLAGFQSSLGWWCPPRRYLRGRKRC